MLNSTEFFSRVIHLRAHPAPGDIGHIEGARA
jgi:hypothetical protein